MQDSLLLQAETLQNLLISVATGGSASDSSEFKRLRATIISDSSLKQICPRFLHTHRDLSQFWQFIKSKYSHYHERREYLWQEFHPMLGRVIN